MSSRKERKKERLVGKVTSYLTVIRTRACIFTRVSSRNKLTIRDMCVTRTSVFQACIKVELACVYTRMYTYIHICVHTHVHVYIYIIHTYCTYNIYKYIYMHILMDMYTRILYTLHTCIYTHAHTHRHTRTH